MFLRSIVPYFFSERSETLGENSDQEGQKETLLRSLWNQFLVVAKHVQSPYEPIRLDDEFSVVESVKYCMASSAGQKIQKIGWVRTKAKSWVVGREGWKDEVVKSRNELNALLHHDFLSRLIEMVLPSLKEKALKGINENQSCFSSFVNLENEYFEDLVLSLIYKAICNLARHSITSYITREGPTPSRDVTNLIIEDFLEFVFTHFNSVDSELFLTILQEPDGDAKIQKLRDLMRPMSTELLLRVFPEGKESLNLGVCIASSVWEALENEVIPSICVAAYSQAKCPSFNHGDVPQNLEKKGSAFLGSITTLISRNCLNAGPNIISRNKKEIAKAALSLSNVNKNDHQDLIVWITKILEEISESQSSGLQNLWLSIVNNIDVLTRHIFTVIASSEEGDNAISIVVNKLGTAILGFYRDHNIYEEVSRVDKIRLKKEREKEKVSLFAPLANDLLEAASLRDDPIIAFFNKTILPELFYHFSSDMIAYEIETQSTKNTLQRKLFDRNQLLMGSSRQLQNYYAEVVRGIDQENTTCEAIFWGQAGVTGVVENVEKVSTRSALDIRKIVENYVKNNTDKLAGYINNYLPRDLRVSDPDCDEITEGLKEITGSEERDVLTPMLNYCERLLGVMLFKLLTALAENTHVKKVVSPENNRNNLIIATLINNLFALLSSDFKEIPDQLQQLNSQLLTEDERDEKVREIFKPVSLSLALLAGKDWKKIIPAPEMLKDILEEFTLEIALPSLIHDLYTQLHSWIDQDHIVEEELFETFESTNPKAVVDSTGAYVESLIPYSLKTNPDIVTNLLMTQSEVYLSHLEPSQKSQLHRIVLGNVVECGREESNNAVWKASSAYVKSITLRIASRISSQIKLNERVRSVNGESTFLLDSTVKTLHIVKEHFVAISKIPEKNRLTPAHRVLHQKMLKGFSDAEMLHPALRGDLTVSEVEREKNRLKYFYKPLSKKIIELAGIESSQDFPVPVIIRDHVWSSFQNKIMPQVLMILFQDFLEPRNINNLILGIIEYLNSEIESIDEDHYIENDHHQRELNEASGEIIKSMVSLIPQIFSKTVIPADKLKKMTAEELGGLLRRKLQNTTMLKLTDTLLAKTKMGDLKDGALKDPLSQAKDDSNVERELKKKMTMYISNQVKAKVRVSLENQWKVLQASFDRFVRIILGDLGGAIKKVLDKVFRFIIFTLLGPILNIVFFNILWFFIDILISRKAVELIKDAQMKIHENLAFNVVDSWMETMLIAKKEREKE